MLITVIQPSRSCLAEILSRDRLTDVTVNPELAPESRAAVVVRGGRDKARPIKRASVRSKAAYQRLYGRSRTVTLTITFRDDEPRVWCFGCVDTTRCW